MDSSPKMKKIVKRLLFTVAIVAVLYLATVVALRLFLPKDRIRQAIEQELSRALDRDVAVTDVSVGIYPDIELVGSGIHVASPGHEDDLASVRRVRIDMDLSKLLRRQYKIENIVVASPHIALVRNPHGEWNVQDLIAKTRRDKEPATEPEQKGRQVEIGPIHINNGAIRIHDQASGRTIAATNIKAVLDMKKKEFQLKSVSVSYPPIEGRATATISRFSEPDPLLDLEARILVLKQGPLADFAPELDSDDEIADIIAKASGPLNNLKIESDFSVNRKATHGLQTTGILRGTLNADEGVLEVSALEPRFGDSTLALSGLGSNLWKHERTLALEGTGTLVPKQLLSLAGDDLVQKLQPEGTADAQLSLTASMQTIYMTANLDLLNTGMLIPNVMTKPAGIPADLVIDGRYTIPDEIVIHNFTLDIATGHIDGTAKVLPGQEPWAQTSLKGANIPLDHLDRLPEIDFEEGALSFNAEIWQSNPSEKQVNHEGEASLNNAVLTTQHLKEPVKNINADIAWKNEQATVKSASFLFADSSFQTQAEIEGFTKPTIIGKVHADSLDLTKIAAAFRNDSPEKETRADPSRSTSDTAGTEQKLSLTLAVEAQAVYANTLKADSFAATWQTSGKTHIFDPVTMNVFGGRLTGDFTLDASSRPLAWQTNLTGQNMDLEEILAQMETKETKARGLLNADATLNAIIAGNMKDALGSLDGQITLTATDGEIRQYSLLKNIFLLMQVPVGLALIPGVREFAALNTILEAAKTRGRSLNPAVTTFNRIQGEFQITDGVAHTENIRLESGMADLIGKGNIDLPNQQLDMVVTATPMGAIGSLLGMTPIIGGALKGAKETIVSTKFLVKGPIADPEVKVAAVEKLKEIGSGEEKQPQMSSETEESGQSVPANEK
ncbi:MAG: hypothetical protein Kow0099_30100 [Candidatus Abyssubacteria bacterium]